MLQTNLINSIVPISRFNRGEAGKIFEEVDECGMKVVVKNNKPACVLLSPEKYEELMELLEDQELLALAEERARHNKASNNISQDDLLKANGISYEDLAEIEVEIE